MIKSPDAISELICNRKHPFPQVVDRPDKPQKHRYERRKVKQYIHVENWSSEEEN